MAAQIVLEDQQSTYGGPYGFYTVTLEPSNRTLDSVTVKCTVSAHLKYDESNTQYGVKCYLHIGGGEDDWHEFTLVPYGTWWTGTATKTASTTITVSGLSAAQTEIVGIKFKAVEGGGATSGPGLIPTACADLVIDMFGGIAAINIDGTWRAALPWLNVEGVWKMVMPWVRVGYKWRSIGGVIEYKSDLLSITDDGLGNVGMVFAETATVEQNDGNVSIAANCFWQKEGGNIEIL